MLKDKTNETKVKEVCSQCGKRQRPDAKQNGSTGWIFKVNSCSCGEPETSEKDTSTQNDSPTDNTNATSRNDPPVSETDNANSEAEVHPELIDGRYQVLEVLGKGGMGTVYKVQDQQTDAIFAMKVLQQSLSDDAAALKRFEQEATAAAQLNHPNLVSVYNHGITEAGQAYLLMDYVNGETLGQAIKQQGSIEEKRAISIFHQICDTLAHAHEKGIVHRDIKPANIILSKTEGGAESARVVDFGIAKALPSDDRETRDLTKTGEVFGSPHYMSPEQCLGFMLDQRSDIYSFGCLMYETLTGETPFAGSNSIQLVVKHINDIPKPFSKNLMGTATMKSLQSVALKCLEKNQADRFQTFSEIIESLKKIESGKKVSFDASTTTQKPFFSGKAAVLLPLAVVLVPAFYYIVGKTKSEYIGAVFELTAIGILGAVSLFLLRTARKNFRMMTSEKALRRQVWSSHLCLFAGLTVGGLIPYLISSFICSNIKIAPTFEPIVNGLFLLSAASLGFNIFLSVAILVCGAGYLLDRSSERTKIRSVTGKALGISTGILVAAFTLFPKQLAFVPGDIGSMFDYLSSYNLSSDVPKTLYRVALNMNPDDMALAKRCAWMSARSMDYATAIKDYTYLIEHTKKTETNNHEIKEYYSNRGDIYEGLGNYSAALADYKHSLENTNPQDFDSYHYYGRARIYRKLNRLDDALADYSKIIEGQPENVNAYRNRAAVYLQKSNFQAALADTDRLLTLRSGKNAGSFALRGYIYEMMNESAKAHADYEAAIGNPQSDAKRGFYRGGRDAENTMGRIVAYMKLGQPDKAREELDRMKNQKYFNIRTYQSAIDDYPDLLRQELERLIPELKKTDGEKKNFAPTLRGN